MDRNYPKALIAVTAAVLFASVSAHASEMDERIESSVKSSYVFRTYLKDDSISTQSKDGVVTLTGIVAEESHKSLAYETVTSLPEVKSVDNQLELKAERAVENSDGWIGTQVKYSLLYNKQVSGMKTQVSVADGIVTLQGEAENQAQIDLAGEYAKDIKGVKNIKNEMTLAEIPSEPKTTLKERIDDASITAQIKMALLVNQSTSAFKTGVKTSEGVVTLSGNTRTAAERDRVGKVADNANGVIKVINNMTIDDTLSKM